MKKTFLKSAAAVLAAMLLFTGCAQKVQFSFHAYWTSSGNYSENFSETSVYSVTHVTDYVRETAEKTTDDFSAKENEHFSVKFENGEYVVKVSAISSLPQELRDRGIDVGDYTELYKIETDFNIDVTYTVTKTEKSYAFHDNIHSTAYFKSTWLAPIYSSKSYASTTVGGNADDVKIQRTEYETEINWYAEAGKALLKKIPKEKPVTEYDNDNAYLFRTVSGDPVSIKYEEGTVLDNETLLFALRGLKPKSDSFSQSLKIVDTAYGSEQSVSAASSRSYSYDNDWTLVSKGGEEKTITENMPVCLVTVQRGNSTYSGTPKHCYYQLESDKSTAYRALFVRMVDKLPNNLGALDYSLTSMTTSE
ncbi:MAG: hypothetical protein DBX59_03145 [Bacillota bacterium]|nr:MAG: hypothetical protein DBX59_03145 [Bacillota bacterium]